MATSPARRGVQLCDDDLLELFGFCSISELASRLSLVCSQFWRCACPKMFEQNPRFVELTVGAIYETEVAEGGQQRQVFRENTIYARRVVGAEEADRQEVPEWKRVPIPLVPPPANILGIRRITCISRLSDEVALSFFGAIAPFLARGVLCIRNEAGRSFLGGPMATWASKLYKHFYKCRELVLPHTGYENVQQMLQDPLLKQIPRLRLRCALSSANFVHVAQLNQLVTKWLQLPIVDSRPIHRRLVIQREMPQYHHTFPECAFRSIVNGTVRLLMQEFLASKVQCNYRLTAIIQLDSGDAKVGEAQLVPFQLHNQATGELLELRVQEGSRRRVPEADLIYELIRTNGEEEEEEMDGEEAEGCHVELI